MMQYGLIGHPVGHSFSKIIHGMLGNNEYEIIDLQPDMVRDFLSDRKFKGLNVTLPYKEVVLACLDEVEERAKEIGAVNTIVNRDGKLIGYNTDYFGFRDLFLRHWKGELSEQNIVILGTGGTSKTVLRVLMDLGAKNVYRISRDKRGERIISWEDAVDLKAQIIINTTPVGMYPNVGEHCIPKRYQEGMYSCAKLCLDVVYRPFETLFIKEAKRRNINAEGGLYMLVAQAVHGAELFKGQEQAENAIAETFTKMKEYLQDELHICVTEKLQGNIVAPPSKSYSHRHLILAAMTDGVSVLKGLGNSRDIDITMHALKTFGADIQIVEQNEKERTVQVDGRRFLKTSEDLSIYCGESGSSLRFLLPVALLGGKGTTFWGEDGLWKRPMNVYEDLCKQCGIDYKTLGNTIEVKGQLGRLTTAIPGGVSSQFISGLLMTLPFVEGDSKIELLPPVESFPYIKMTVEALKEWGITVLIDENCIVIPGGQKISAREIVIEKDYSNGAYLWAYKLLNEELNIEGVEEDTLQGDKVFKDIFRRLKEETTPTINMEDTPDLAPIAMAVAACYNGAVFTGTRRLAMKESDRGRVMLEELKKFGIDGKMQENSICIMPGKLQAPTESVYGHNDHRIVMALTFLLTITGGNIRGCKAVSKSYPTYFEDLKECGLLTLEN